jgi:hypothetical protein
MGTSPIRMIEELGPTCTRRLESWVNSAAGARRGVAMVVMIGVTDQPVECGSRRPRPAAEAAAVRRTRRLPLPGAAATLPPAAQGIGWALNEEYYFGSEGRLLNTSFPDYRMPTSLDLPMLDTAIVEVANPGHLRRQARGAHRAAPGRGRQRHPRCRRAGSWRRSTRTRAQRGVAVLGAISVAAPLSTVAYVAAAGRSD